MVYGRRSTGTRGSGGRQTAGRGTAVLRRRGLTYRLVDGVSKVGKAVRVRAIGSPSSSKIAIPQKHKPVDKSAYK